MIHCFSAWTLFLRSFFFLFHFLMCLCCSSFVAIFLLRRWVPCLIADFTDMNVGIKPSCLHFIIKSMSILTLWCFVVSSCNCCVLCNISCPCFFLRTLKTLVGAYNFNLKKIRSTNIFGRQKDLKCYFKTIYSDLHFKVYYQSVAIIQ